MANRDEVIQRLGWDIFAVDLGSPRTTASQDIAGTTLETLAFTASHGGLITGYFLAPKAANAPAILYCHAHGARYDIGISELTEGRPALLRPYLHDLAQAGFAVLCLEMPTFGARATPDESTLSKALLWQGKTLFGQMLGELAGGLSYLARHPRIDPARIGTLGISMGGTHAWWLAALDDRVAAAVSLCCFADLGALVDAHAHDGHGAYMTVPGLLTHCTTGQLAGLAAPRPQLHCIGLDDAFTPERAVKIAQTDLQHAYKTHPHMLQFHMEHGVGHRETQPMREATLAFLKKHLS